MEYRAIHKWKLEVILNHSLVLHLKCLSSNPVCRKYLMSWSKKSNRSNCLYKAESKSWTLKVQFASNNFKVFAN